MEKVEERTTPELLELTLQLHSRAITQPNNRKMHDAYVEARQGLEKRMQANGNAVLPLVSGSLQSNNNDDINIYAAYDKGKWCASGYGKIKEPFNTPQEALESILIERQ
jgi:hypothetical protein